MGMEHKFILAVSTPNRDLYGELIEYLTVSEQLIEKPGLIEFRMSDPAVIDFLKKEFPEIARGESLAASDIVEKAREAFPPPFLHRDIVMGRLDDLDEEEIEERLADYEQRLEGNHVAIATTLKSPDTIPMAWEDMKQFIADYREFIVDEVGHEDFVPDDFETTEALMNGEEDAISEASLTFEIVLPLHDITNSAFFLRQRQILGYPEWGGDPPPDDLHYIFAEIDHDEYLHLFCLHFMGAAQRWEDVEVEILTVPTTC